MLDLSALTPMHQDCVDVRRFSLNNMRGVAMLKGLASVKRIRTLQHFELPNTLYLVFQHCKIKSQQSVFSVCKPFKVDVFYIA